MSGRTVVARAYAVDTSELERGAASGLIARFVQDVVGERCCVVEVVNNGKRLSLVLLVEWVDLAREAYERRVISVDDDMALPRAALRVVVDGFPADWDHPPSVRRPKLEVYTADDGVPHLAITDVGDAAEVSDADRCPGGDAACDR